MNSLHFNLAFDYLCRFGSIHRWFETGCVSCQCQRTDYRFNLRHRRRHPTDLNLLNTDNYDDSYVGGLKELVQQNSEYIPALIDTAEDLWDFQL